MTVCSELCIDCPQKFITFTHKLVQALPIGDDAMHVGVVEYNTEAKLVTKLEGDKAKITQQLDGGIISSCHKLFDKNFWSDCAALTVHSDCTVTVCSHCTVTVHNHCAVTVCSHCIVTVHSDYTVTVR